MRKNIKELTDQQAKEILEFVYPNETDLSNPKNYKYWFTKLSFESTMDKNGREQLTFDFLPIIGIQYHNGQDNCILYFNNSKVVLWLYNNGFEIEEFLIANQHYSEMEKDFNNFAFGIEYIAKGEDGFKDGYKHNWTLDYVKKKCSELIEEYYYKDYN